MAVDMNGYRLYTSHQVVAIPGGKELCCKLCRHCRTDDRMRQRYVCDETMEIIWDANKVGEWCPLDEKKLLDWGWTEGTNGEA